MVIDSDFIIVFEIETFGDSQWFYHQTWNRNI